MIDKFTNLLGLLLRSLASAARCTPLLLGTLIFCALSTSVALAARNAVVTSEKAVIWADAQRTAPLGYARRGKVLRVGEKERSKGQVITVIVSGKLAYISVDDVAFEDTEKAEEVDKEATRFKESTEKIFTQSIGFSVVQFSARESKDSKAERPGDDWSFQGGQLKGMIQKVDSRVGVVFLFDYLYGENKIEDQTETLRIFEMGIGGSLALLNFRHLQLKVEALALLVPWAQYEAPPLFTLNGYGVGGLGQGTLSIYPSESLGFEISAGVKTVKIFKIKRPAPFEEFSPLFVGAQLSAGLLYRF